MERLWAADGAAFTARAVQDGLAGRNLATTTVLTVLGRLERKGLVVARARAVGRTTTGRPAAARTTSPR